MKKRSIWKDVAITVFILGVAFVISVSFQNVFGIDEQITTLFAFAVFLISLLTNGYVYGIISSCVSTLAINYAFTFPFFAFDFITPVNLISAVVMITIALLTGALTTKVKRNEEIRLESEKERMRANLLRAVSHDIRTPLTTIYGSAATLLENGDSLSPDQRKLMLQSIQNDSVWLVRMVENLLSVTRLDSDNVKIAKVPTVLDDLIASVLVKFKKRYAAQMVLLSMPEDILIVPMDAMLIEQVLVNLLENAVMHGEGMTKLELRVYAEDQQAVFEVRDNGCGIPKEKLQDLFIGFYEQKEGSVDSHKKNTGIGLSVCATIVSAHGGMISAENLPDGGALFRFTLRLEETVNEQ
ncbi:MAG: PAS domain-containing sensor histidine kinase [Clostridia bacterium]|nr:PAS domain-containing sensor histidine kinase [Clostridia bacterium]